MRIASRSRLWAVDCSSTKVNIASAPASRLNCVGIFDPRELASEEKKSVVGNILVFVHPPGSLARRKSSFFIVCCVWCLFFVFVEFSPSLPLVSFPLFSLLSTHYSITSISLSSGCWDSFLWWMMFDHSPIFVFWFHSFLFRLRKPSGDYAAISCESFLNHGKQLKYLLHSKTDEASDFAPFNNLLNIIVQFYFVPTGR